jgi:hypothetical protein
LSNPYESYVHLGASRNINNPFLGDDAISRVRCMMQIEISCPSFVIRSQMKQERIYQKKRQMIEKYIKKQKVVDHKQILNEVDVDYDTLMKILAELRNEGRLK